MLYGQLHECSSILPRDGQFTHAAERVLDFAEEDPSEVASNTDRCNSTQ
jgi:hypothetical protein